MGTNSKGKWTKCFSTSMFQWWNCGKKKEKEQVDTSASLLKHRETGKLNPSPPGICGAPWREEKTTKTHHTNQNPKPVSISCSPSAGNSQFNCISGIAFAAMLMCQTVVREEAKHHILKISSRPRKKRQHFLLAVAFLWSYECDLNSGQKAAITFLSALRPSPV